MKTYEKYKDSGIEWIGEIPEHWETKRLKYMGYLYGGLAGKSSNHFNQISHSNNKPFIPFTNICNNIVIDPNQMQYVVIEDGEKQNTVQKGDLFFMMSSENFDDAGKSSILLHDLEETYLNSFCKGFRFSNDSYYPSFINYLLLSKPFRSLVLTEANGYTRINLKIDKIHNIPVIYATNIQEQTTIATFLDHKTAEIDRIIANKQRLIALYQEEKQAIINQAVTKGLDPTVKLKDSGVEWLGEIPEHWEVKKLKYIAKIKTGYTPSKNEESNYSEDGIAWAKPDDLNEFKPITDSKEKISNEGLKPQNIVAVNSVLVCCIGSIGKFGVAGIDLATNQQINSVTFKNAIIPHFGKYLIYSSKNEHIKESNGNVVRILNSESQSRILFAIPPLEEQSLITKFIENEINRLETIISKFNKQIELLQEYRTTLISEVVTGKIKVPQ